MVPTLTVTPFSTNPLPTCLYQTDSLRQIIRMVRFTIANRQGLAAILGDVGLGKSSLLRFLFSEYYARPDCVATFVTAGELAAYALVRKICADFQIPPKRSRLAQQDALEEFLVSQHQEGRTVVIFLDEAQTLDSRSMESLRSMLNFETDKAKLAQFVIAGQLELRDRLLHKRHKALMSRVFSPCLLNRLTLEETDAMLRERCRFEGIAWPFAPGAVAAIQARSGGVPRDSLTLAAHCYDLSLEERSSITPATVERVGAAMDVRDGQA
jgi:type II secretory pathway predicted ATPase ExeA